MTLCSNHKPRGPRHPAKQSKTLIPPSRLVSPRAKPSQAAPTRLRHIRPHHHRRPTPISSYAEQRRRRRRRLPPSRRAPSPRQLIRRRSSGFLPSPPLPSQVASSLPRTPPRARRRGGRRGDPWTVRSTSAASLGAPATSCRCARPPPALPLNRASEPSDDRPPPSAPAAAVALTSCCLAACWAFTGFEFLRGMIYHSGSQVQSRGAWCDLWSPV